MKKVRLTREYILGYLKEKGRQFFTVEDFASMFHITPNYAAQVVLRLKRGGEIVEVEKGKYVLSGMEEDPFVIGCFSVDPSYISFKTALYIHGLIDKYEEEEVYVATPKRKSPFSFRHFIFRYITLKPYRFFGFSSIIKDDRNIRVAFPEKAIIDAVEEPRYGPDFEDLIRILFESEDRISISRLIKYAIKMQDKSLIARLGYILEEAGIDMDIPEDYLPKDYIKLIPSGERRGKWITRWKIIDNR